MPNGDHRLSRCGWCMLNRANIERGYVPRDPPDLWPLPQRCTIRDFEILDPERTYCLNHTDWNPGPARTPVGGVFGCAPRSERTLLRPAPDSPEIREGLLALLEGLEEHPTAHAPSPAFEYEVIAQLAALRETRAAPGLERVAAFADPPSEPDRPGRGRDQARLRALARRALAHLRGESPPDAPWPSAGPCLFCGAFSAPERADATHVRCRSCGAMLATQHGVVLAGFLAKAVGDRPGRDPHDPIPWVLPPPGGRTLLPDETLEPAGCWECGTRLQNPTPQIHRTVTCPGCLRPIGVGGPPAPTMPVVPTPRPSAPARLAAMGAALGVPLAIGAAALAVLPWIEEPEQLARNALLTVAGAVFAGAALAAIAGGRADAWAQDRLGRTVVAAIMCAAIVVWVAVLVSGV